MNKEQVNYKVKKSVKDAFNGIAESNSLNKSNWIEKQMIKYIESQVIHGNGITDDTEYIQNGGKISKGEVLIWK